jgi:hypothetical protein
MKDLVWCSCMREEAKVEERWSKGRRRSVEGARRKGRPEKVKGVGGGRSDGVG